MNNDQRKAIDLHYPDLIEALAIGSSPLLYFRGKGALSDDQMSVIQSVKGTPADRASSLLKILRLVDKGWSSLVGYLKDNNMSLLAKKLEDSLDSIQKDTKGTGSTATTSTDEKSPAMKEATSAAAVSMENTSFRIEHRKRTMPNDIDPATFEAEVRLAESTELKRRKLQHSVCLVRTEPVHDETEKPGPKARIENSGTGVLVEINLKDCVKRGILTGYKMFSYDRPYMFIVITLQFRGEPSLAPQPFQFKLYDNAYVFACEFLNCSFAELRDEDVTRLKETRGCHFLNVHPFDLGPYQAQNVIAANAKEISKQSDALSFNNVFYFYSNVELQVGSPVVDNKCDVVGIYTDYGWHLFYNSMATMSSHIMSAIARDYDSNKHSKTPLSRLVTSLSPRVVSNLKNNGLLNTNTTNTAFIQEVSWSPCRFWKAVESMLGASAYRKIQKSHSVVTISNMLQREKQQVSQKDKEGILVAMAIKAFLSQYDPTLRNFKHVKVGYDIEWLLRDLVAILTELVDRIIANTGMIVVELSAIIKNKELIESYRFEDTGADSARMLCDLLKPLNSCFDQIQDRDAWLPANQQFFAMLSGIRELLFIDLCIIYSQAAVSNRPNEPASLKLVEKIQHQRTHHSWYWRAKYTFRMGESEILRAFFGPWHRQDVYPESDFERDANEEVYDAMRKAVKSVEEGV